MKRSQLINIICSLLLASLLVLSTVLLAVFLPYEESAKLIVTSAGAQKEYDGTPLVAHSYEILSGKLKNGHSIRASFSGSQTEIGTSENFFSIQIVDSFENDVTDSYQIEIVFGKLNVTRQSATNGDDPLGGSIVDTDQSVGGGSRIDLGGRIAAFDTIGSDSKICLRVKNKEIDTVYLKIKSFGDYSGNAWGEAEEYDKLLNSGLSASYLSSLAINKTDSVIEIKSFTDQFFLPYYMSYTDFKNHNIQTSDVAFSGSTEYIYSVAYGRFDYQKVFGLSSVHQPYEREYRSFVESQYLEIDDETRAYMDKIIRVNSLRADDSLSTVQKVAEYIKNSAEYSQNYDRSLDSEENIVLAFLSTYKEGICQHYASAATLLFRALGIPARYTVGFVATTKAEEWVNVRGNSAHAWVEVYINNMGWVMVEVTNGYPGPGKTDSFEYNASITPEWTDKEYDGTPLYAKNRVTGFEEFEEMGFTYTVAVNGTQTELGKSASVIESFTVFDRDGRDVTEKFKLTLNVGTVHVYYSELIFTSESATKVYDGVPLLTDVSTCKMIGGKLREGDFTYMYSQTGITTVQKCSANFHVNVFDAQGYSVDDIYKITKLCGYLTVIPREITVKAADATKVFDGRALSNNSYTIIEGVLAEGDIILSCKVEGSQYNVGRSDNIITSIKIFDKYWQNVTSNYIIKLEPGVLEVLPQA